MVIKPTPPVAPTVFAEVGFKQKFPSPEDDQPTFGEVLKEAVSHVNSLVIDSGNKNMALALGEIKDVHEVMIAGEKAALATELTLEIRNRVIEAYQQIMRMGL